MMIFYVSEEHFIWKFVLNYIKMLKKIIDFI